MRKTRIEYHINDREKHIYISFKNRPNETNLFRPNKLNFNKILSKLLLSNMNKKIK